VPVVALVIPAHTVRAVYAGSWAASWGRHPRTTSFNPAWTMRLRKRTVALTLRWS